MTMAPKSAEDMAILDSKSCPECGKKTWSLVEKPKQDDKGRWHHPSCSQIPTYRR